MPYGQRRRQNCSLAPNRMISKIAKTTKANNVAATDGTELNGSLPTKYPRDHESRKQTAPATRKRNGREVCGRSHSSN